MFCFLCVVLLPLTYLLYVNICTTPMGTPSENDTFTSSTTPNENDTTLTPSISLSENDIRTPHTLTIEVLNRVSVNTRLEKTRLQTSQPTRRTKNNVSLTKPTSVPAMDKNCSNRVPSIVHLTVFQNNNNMSVFRFHHVISVMSSLRFIQPQFIMFWHDGVPTGKWWQFIRQKINESTTTLIMMKREAPTTIFGNPIHLIEHKSDIVRLEAVMKYGGIYHDLDVVMVRPLDPLFCYETTMGEELPGSFCNGFFMSVANATFLRLWYDSYRTFKSEQWAYHSAIIPGIIAERHPGLIHVETDTIHNPHWISYERRKLHEDGVFYNWTARNYAVHLWYRYHNVDYDPESIKRLNKTIGQIFRYIFYGNSDMI